MKKGNKSNRIRALLAENKNPQEITTVITKEFGGKTDVNNTLVYQVRSKQQKLLAQAEAEPVKNGSNGHSRLATPLTKLARQLLSEGKSVDETIDTVIKELGVDPNKARASVVNLHGRMTNKPKTKTQTVEATVAFCPRCGCNIQAVAVAMRM